MCLIRVRAKLCKYYSVQYLTSVCLIFVWNVTQKEAMTHWNSYLTCAAVLSFCGFLLIYIFIIKCILIFNMSKSRCHWAWIQCRVFAQSTAPSICIVTSFWSRHFLLKTSITNNWITIWNVYHYHFRLLALSSCCVDTSKISAVCFWCWFRSCVSCCVCLDTWSSWSSISGWCTAPWPPTSLPASSSTS